MNKTGTIDNRVTALEVQVSRIVSDIESEKDTRARANRDVVSELKSIDERLRSIERKAAMLIGAFAIGELILRLFVK